MMVAAGQWLKVMTGAMATNEDKDQHNMLVNSGNHNSDRSNGNNNTINAQDSDDSNGYSSVGDNEDLNNSGGNNGVGDNDILGNGSGISGAGCHQASREIIKDI